MKREYPWTLYDLMLEKYCDRIICKRNGNFYGGRKKLEIPKTYWCSTCGEVEGDPRSKLTISPSSISMPPLSHGLAKICVICGEAVR